MKERGCNSVKEVRTSLRPRPETECSDPCDVTPNSVHARPHRDEIEAGIQVMASMRHTITFSGSSVSLVNKVTGQAFYLAVERHDETCPSVDRNQYISWTATITRRLHLVCPGNCTEYLWLILHTLALSAWSFAKVHRAAITRFQAVHSVD